MSMEFCTEHSESYDTDHLEGCPGCNEDARKAGLQAQKEDRSVKECPYIDGDILYEHWHEGYNSGLYERWSQHKIHEQSLKIATM